MYQVLSKKLWIMYSIIALPVLTTLPDLSFGKSQLAIPSLKKLRAMNGINPAPYDQFWARWKLITTRYRKDNGEQRFVYANRIAYDAMKKGSLNFPRGSVFGKLAFKTVSDTQFPNSYEPSNFTRMQLMVKDIKKFKPTDGWSYYIYVDGKNHSPKQDHNKNLACHACHTLVKERDFVFSAPTFLSTMGELYSELGDTFRSKFRRHRSIDLSDFEKKIISLLNKNPKHVMLKRMRLFSGSLYESIGPLAKYVKESGDVYIIVDPVKKRFLAAEKQGQANAKCYAGGTQIYLSYYKNGQFSVKKGNVCNGKNEWVGSRKLPKEFFGRF
ncbi:MAG: cytochrome P460 family protein [Oligoflexales bacterium]